MATWPPVIDDDGTGNTGTPTDYAFFQQIKGYIDGAAGSGAVTITSGGITDILLPVPQPFYYVTFNSTADITIRRITAGRHGDRVLFENLNTGIAWFQYFAASGTGASLINRVTSGSTPIAHVGSALYVYDSALGCWMLSQHDQGKSIRVPYAASNYEVAGGTGTWIVEAGDINRHDFLLIGNELFTSVFIATSTITGTVTGLRIKGFPFTLPGVPLSLPAMFYAPPWSVINSYAYQTGIVLERFDGSAFPATTNATNIGSQMHFLLT